MDKEISLTIEGEPNQEVQVWYRGDPGSDSDDPAPIIYTGRLGLAGHVTISVPRAYLVVGFPTRRNGIPIRLDEETGSSKTVRLT